MERGLHAQPNPNEEAASRPIDRESAEQQALRPSDIRRLLMLGLVEYDGEAFVLTDLGMRRLGLAS